MTALFTRIAGSKVTVSESIFPSNYDQKVATSNHRGILTAVEIEFVVVVPAASPSVNLISPILARQLILLITFACPARCLLVRLYNQATNEHSRDIVTKFLQADPSQRLGNLAAGMDEARRHPYFADIDWNALAHKRMPVRCLELWLS